MVYLDTTIDRSTCELRSQRNGGSSAQRGLLKVHSAAWHRPARPRLGQHGGCGARGLRRRACLIVDDCGSVSSNRVELWKGTRWFRTCQSPRLLHANHKRLKNGALNYSVQAELTFSVLCVLDSTLHIDNTQTTLPPGDYPG